MIKLRPLALICALLSLPLMGYADVSPPGTFPTRLNTTYSLQAPAPPATSLQTLIALDGAVSQVVVQRVGTLTGVLNGRFTVDVNVFGGFALTANGLTGGGSLTHNFRVADQLDLVLGAFVQGTVNGRIGGGVVFGASLHF